MNECSWLHPNADASNNSCLGPVVSERKPVITSKAYTLYWGWLRDHTCFVATIIRVADVHVSDGLIWQNVSRLSDIKITPHIWLSHGEWLSFIHQNIYLFEVRYKNFTACVKSLEELQTMRIKKDQ